MVISLSAREIMVAAAMSKKAKLYGIPDDFERLSQEELSAAIQETKNSLWRKHYLAMDFDGNTSLSEEIQTIVMFCTECEKYLSLVTRSQNSSLGKVLVWRQSGKYLYAAVNDKTYHFSFMGAKEVENCLLRLIPWSGKSRSGKTTKITQTVLKKAKRRANTKDFDGAALLLRQQGADEVSSRIIANALLEKTAVVSFVSIDRTVLPSKAEQCMFSVDADGYLLVEPCMEGYRSAASFEDIAEQKLKAKVNTLLDHFFSSGGDADEE